MGSFYFLKKKDPPPPLEIKNHTLWVLFIVILIDTFLLKWDQTYKNNNPMSVNVTVLFKLDDLNVPNSIKWRQKKEWNVKLIVYFDYVDILLNLFILTLTFTFICSCHYGDVLWPLTPGRWPGYGHKWELCHRNRSHVLYTGNSVVNTYMYYISGYLCIIIFLKFYSNP